MRIRWLVALLSAAGAQMAFAIDVTECGRVIEAGQVGELKNDLACVAGQSSLEVATGVLLQRGAKLRMNGFTISGDGTGAGVQCLKNRCAIEGPGEIRGVFAGVDCGGCRVTTRDLVVRENGEGIYVPLNGTLVAKRVVASDNARSGIWAQAVRGTDIDARRNGLNGVSSNSQLRVCRLDATGNGRSGALCGGARTGSSIPPSSATTSPVAATTSSPRGACSWSAPSAGGTRRSATGARRSTTSSAPSAALPTDRPSAWSGNHADREGAHPNIASVERRVDAVQAALDARGLKPGEFIDQFEHVTEETWIPENGARVVAKSMIGVARL